MQKRLSAIFLAVVMFLAMVTPVYAATNATLSVSSTTVTAGESVTFTASATTGNNSGTTLSVYYSETDSTTGGTLIAKSDSLKKGAGVAVTYETTITPTTGYYYAKASDNKDATSQTVYMSVVEPKTYMVTYDANGGDNAPVDSTNYTAGTTAALSGAGDMVREGYTFSGWQNGFNFYNVGDIITITADITLSAMWTQEITVAPVESYKVTYNANGGENAPVDSTNYTAGTTATLSDAGDMVREGYTFSGWQNGFNFYNVGDIITITADITLSAMWTQEIAVAPVESYKVTYNANGGENAPVDSTNYTAGTTATLSGAGDMVREGYTFSGWQNGFNFYNVGDTITITADITLSAMWTKEIVVAPVEAYKVIYNANGAKGDLPVDATNYVVGTTATILDQGTLSRQGYTFVGWNTAANGKGTSYGAGESISINASVTLFAQWSQNIYHISYDANGGKDAPVDTMNYYGTVFGQAAVSGNMTRSGYVFAGWNTDAKGNGTAYQPGDWVSANGNITLYAQWKNAVYNITYNANGGKNAPVDTMDYYGMVYGQAAASGNMTRSNYVFAGWNTDAKGNGTAYQPGDWVSANGNITLYAQWKNAVYNITYDANGGKNAPVDTMDYYGTVFGKAAVSGNMTRSGYVFAGWNTDAKGNGTAYQPDEWVSANGNITLYAQWENAVYNITYDANGGKNAPADTMDYYSMVFGQAAASGNMTRSGYVFTGWNTDAKGNGTAYQSGEWVSANSNITLYAQWKKDDVKKVSDAEFLHERADRLRKGMSQNELRLNGKVLTLVIDGREFVLSRNANNRNISGEIALGDGYFLKYDIKGNGSNIKDFRIIKK